LEHLKKDDWKNMGINVKKKLLKVAELLGSEELMYKVVGLLEDENKVIVKDAAESFGKLYAKVSKNERNQYDLKEWLNHKNPAYRMAALKAIGEGEIVEMFDDVVKLLNDKYWSVRKSAAYALKKLGDMGYVLSVAYGQSIFTNYTKAVKIFEALEEEEKERVIEYLRGEKFVKNQDINIKRGAIWFIESAKIVEMFDEAIEFMRNSAGRYKIRIRVGNPTYKKKYLLMQDILHLMNLGNIGYVLGAVFYVKEFRNEPKYLNRYKKEKYAEKAIDIYENMSKEEKNALEKYLSSFGLEIEQLVID